MPWRLLCARHPRADAPALRGTARSLPRSRSARQHHLQPGAGIGGAVEPQLAPRCRDPVSEPGEPEACACPAHAVVPNLHGELAVLACEGDPHAMDVTMLDRVGQALADD